jgi:hypothetical protein
LNESRRSLDPVPIDARTGITALFRTSRLIALGEAHRVAQQHALIRELLFDAQFSETIDDIVVEFGNALHQPVLDRYLAGEEVPESQLRPVWSECIGGAGNRVFESPVYPAFFHAVRSSRKRRRSESPRVLLGDPPFDWDAFRRRSAGVAELARALRRRDEFFAEVVERNVLALGRRALLLAGSLHFSRRSESVEGNAVQRLERAHGRCCTVVLPHYLFRDVVQRRPAEAAVLERRLASWPRPVLAAIRGTWLGEIDATLLFGDTAIRIEPDGSRVEVHTPLLDENGVPSAQVTLGEVADTYLYLGPSRSLTLVPPT